MIYIYDYNQSESSKRLYERRKGSHSRRINDKEGNMNGFLPLFQRKQRSSWLGGRPDEVEVPLSAERIKRNETVE
jgi:hypothetical protein